MWNLCVTRSLMASTFLTSLTFQLLSYFLVGRITKPVLAVMGNLIQAGANVSKQLL